MQLSAILKQIPDFILIYRQNYTAHEKKHNNSKHTVPFLLLLRLCPAVDGTG